LVSYTFKKHSHESIINIIRYMVDFFLVYGKYELGIGAYFKLKINLVLS
jgi:hypothetical protein